MVRAISKPALIPAAFFAVMNHLPSAADWQTFVGLTAVFQSFSAVLLFFLALRVTESLRWSIVASLAFCLCPSVILASSLSGSLVVPVIPIANYVKVQLSGRARLNSGDGRIGVKLLLVNADGTKFMPFAVPDYVTVSPAGWSEFKFQDYVPTSVLGGAVRAVTVELSPVPISQA